MSYINFVTLTSFLVGRTVKVKIMAFKLKLVFIVNAIVSLLFGLGFIFLPETLLPMLGISNNILGFRVFGSFVISNCVLTFVARNSEDSSARKAILLFEIVGFLILNILMFIFLDLTNFMVWATIILHFLFIAAYLYFFIKKPK